VGRTEEGSEPTLEVGASLGSRAATSELQTDGCVSQRKPLSSSARSCLYRLRLHVLVVYVTDDSGDIFNTPFGFTGPGDSQTCRRTQPGAWLKLPMAKLPTGQW